MTGEDDPLRVGPLPAGVAPHTLTLTFDRIGEDPSIAFGGGVTLVELYAAVYLLDLVAHELRAAELAARLQKRTDQTLAVARSFPRGLDH